MGWVEVTEQDREKQKTRVSGADRKQTESQDCSPNMAVSIIIPSLQSFTNNESRTLEKGRQPHLSLPVSYDTHRRRTYMTLYPTYQGLQ